MQGHFMPLTTGTEMADDGSYSLAEWLVEITSAKIGAAGVRTEKHASAWSPTVYPAQGQQLLRRCLLAEGTGNVDPEAAAQTDFVAAYEKSDICATRMAELKAVVSLAPAPSLYC